MRWLLSALLLLSGPATAQEMAFDLAPTADCLANSRFEDRIVCAGRAAETCMEANPLGTSTQGMSFCLDQEWRWWDSALNIAYGRLMPMERSADAANAAAGGYAASRADGLRAMQRAWIGWRDAHCAYEALQWDGGTGAGPVATACLLEMTARQALALQARLEERSDQ